MYLLLLPGLCCGALSLFLLSDCLDWFQYNFTELKLVFHHAMAPVMTEGGSYIQTAIITSRHRLTKTYEKF